MRASDRAYAALRDDITEWRLLPGTVLAEVEQSERLGVSRTPLREALSRLTAEGLTTTAGSRGVGVSRACGSTKTSPKKLWKRRTTSRDSSRCGTWSSPTGTKLAS